MKESSLRVVVAITEAYPSLLATLCNVSPEFRQERFRSLAMLGLQAEGGAAFLQRPFSFAASESGVIDGRVPLGPIDFTIILNEAVPRLHEALKATPPRLRAERFRSLATIGVQIESGRIAVQPTREPVFEQAMPQPPLHHVAVKVTPPPPTKKRAPSVAGSEASATGASSVATAAEKVSASTAPAPSQSQSVSVTHPSSHPTSVDKVGVGVRSFAKALGSLN